MPDTNVVIFETERFALPHEADYYQRLAKQPGEACIMGGIHLRSDFLAGEEIARNVTNVVWTRPMASPGQ